MNIREALLKEHSKQQALYIADYIGADEDRFATLLNLVVTDENRVVQRGAYVLSFCVEKFPFLLIPHIETLLENLKKEGQHDAVLRNTLRVLTFIEIPEKWHGIVIEHCFNTIAHAHTPIACKAYSMMIMEKLMLQYPEIMPEIQFIVEEQMPYQSAGFRAKGKKILQKISNFERIAQNSPNI